MEVGLHQGMKPNENITVGSNYYENVNEKSF